MSKTLYALTIPVTAAQFAKGDQQGFIVDFGSTNCFINEATFHKHFIPADQVGLAIPASPAPVANALPEGLDPSLLEGRADWQVRVIVEAHLLGEKVHNLNEFIKTDGFDALPEAEGELLLSQLGAMQEYEKILLERIGSFE